MLVVNLVINVLDMVGADGATIAPIFEIWRQVFNVEVLALFLFLESLLLLLLFSFFFAP